MLEVQRVGAGYPDLPVLFDVTLRIEAGQLTSVLGSNAAGKSTLLKAILGDVPTSSGEIFFGDRRITHLPIHERVAAGISYSPEGRRILPTLSTRENLDAGCYGVPPEAVLEQLDVVYELFPVLAERRAQRAGSLSGGEQQMLAIGRALMRRPRLLLVDELSLGLAPVIVSHLYTALRVLCERGLAVLVAEQFQRFEARYSDRWVVLERGTVVAAGGQDDAHLLVGS